MTKLYFHNAISGLSGTLPSTTQSGLTITENVDAVTVNRTMDDNKGQGPQQSKAAVINQSTARTTYFTRFCSQPLNTTSISANTWNYSFAAQQTATAMNFPTASGTTNAIRICAYVWRPSTGAKVADILNANSNADFGSTAATTLKCTFGTFAGSAVSCNVGDIICIEVIFIYTPTTGSKTGTYYYDGNTENTGDGVVVSNHATYIETPQTLLFSAVQRTVTETVSISESVSGLVIPAPGTNTNILTKKGTITLDATSGVHDQSFTGIGFQPKALIIFGAATTSSAFGEGVSLTYGMSDGTTSGSIGSAVKDGATTTSGSIRRNDSIVSILDPITTVTTELVRGALKTFDTDGFTITWNVKNTTQYILHYMAIAGSDITNVKVKHETTGTTATGNKAYTGMGFKPDAMITAATFTATVNTAASGSAQLVIGACANGASTGSWCNVWAQGNANPNDKFLWSPGFLYQRDNNFTNLAIAQPVSFDSDGYTVNYTTAPTASTLAWFYLAIKGGYWKTGTFAQRNGTGTQTVAMPPIGVDPEFLLLAGDNNTTLNAQNQNLGSYLGAADNTAEGVMAYGSTGTTATSMISLTGKAIKVMTPNATASSSTTQAEADVSDMATLAQFTLNWSTADSTARLSGFICLEKNAAAAGQNITKSLTETVTIGETAARQTAKIRARTETVTIGETAARLASKNRTISQTVTTTGTTVRLKGSVKTLSETVTTTGTTSLLRNKIRALTETVSVPATLSRITGKNRTASETVTIAGTPTKTKGIVRPISQTITISDALTMLRNKIRAITQTVSIAETPTRQTAKNRALSQTVSISDALQRIKGSVKVISQTVSISDALNIARAKIRTITQTVSIAETPTRQTAKTRTISQTISITDLVNRAIGARAVIKSLTETVSISDILSILRNKNRSISQTVTTTGTPTKAAGKNKAVSDSVAITDALTLIRNKVRIIIQTITSSESLAKSQSKNRSVTESVSVSDSTSLLRNKIRSIIESISISDFASQTANKGVQHVVRIIDEARVVISDAFYKVREIVEPTITISDFVGCQKTDNTPTNFTKSLTENVVIGLDIATKQASKSRPLTETSSVSGDSAAVTHRGKSRSATENITVSDFCGCTKSQRQISKSITESVSSSDVANIQRGKVRRIGGPG